MKGTVAITLLSLTLFAGCGGQGSDGNKSASSDSSEQNGGLTEFEMVNGIGPVTEEIEIGEIDHELAEQGEGIFETKCSACHKMNERYVGPALGDVLTRRTPTYVMNMVLNSDEMIKKHPEAKKKLAEFMTPMPNQNLSRDQARAVVEYLASEGSSNGTN